MENSVITRFVKLFDVLTLDLKLELMTKLALNIQNSIPKDREMSQEKVEILDGLFGSWKDVDEDVVETIYADRQSSNRGLAID